MSLEDVLSPFPEITRQLSVSSYVSFSLVVLAIDRLVTKINTAIGLADKTTSSRRLPNSMKVKLEEYIPFLEKNVAKMATALHPRFNLHYFENDDKKKVGELLKI